MVAGLSRVMTIDRFAEALRGGMLSLPQDLKAMLRVTDDGDLDDKSRVLACGAILHVLSGQNAIPGVKGVLGYADDVIVLRLVIERIEKTSPELIASHRGEDPEVFGPMAEQTAAIREHLAELMPVLDKVVEALPRLNFEGHTAQQCARDQDAQKWLYDSVHEAITERLELPEDVVARGVKGAGEIRGHLKQRV